MSIKPTRQLGALVLAVLASTTAFAHDVRDLKYGAVLFEFYQQKYFETLVEYDYAKERGGIQHHGSYPQLLKGGVSLSYGLDIQAQEIFSQLIAEHTEEDVQNRAWFYLAKMLYLRGDTARSATTMANIKGGLPADIEQEYRYLAALINIKLGYFDEAEAISQNFRDDDSPYAPYLYFNLGVALGKQQEYKRAFQALSLAASRPRDDEPLSRLADRAHMATAYLQAEQQDFTRAYLNIRKVSANGVFSNRALLGASWASVNSGAFGEALAPLDVLQQRSMAIPEVQEAVLLLPHVYEKLGLPGRAANGFISAHARYENAIEQLQSAREALRDADVLELFVRNMDDILDESDWFGTAPSVSLNALSPFLLDLMSDHSFQSVLKDLRDLYAIRNNLEGWKRKQDDFRIILEARSRSGKLQSRRRNASAYTNQQVALQERYETLRRRASALPAKERERVQWLLNDLAGDIQHAATMAAQLQGEPIEANAADTFVGEIQRNMASLHEELAKTNQLIHQVESVMLELVNAELDVHEERLKYYQVQSQLAKARILDRSLSEKEAEPTQHETDQAAEAKGGSRVRSQREESPASGGEHAA